MSLRSRLILAVGMVALVALLVADVVTYSALRSFLYTRVDQSLQAAHAPLERAIEGTRSPLEGRVATLAPGTYVELRDAAGNTLYAVPALRRGESLTPRLPARINGLQDPVPGALVENRTYLNVSSVQPGGPPFRVLASSLPGGQLILAVPLDDTLATLHRLMAIEVAVTLAALLAALALGWWLVRVGLRPLADVKSTAGAIAEGELDRRVPGDAAPTEVGQVARALNTMLARIQDAFAERDATEAELRRSEERLRRFVADASHELRTPLAAVAAYAELFDRGANHRQEDLARVMAGIRSETGRMGELVEDLLLLARLDEGRPLLREPVELVAVGGQALDAAMAVGPAWPVRLEAQHPVEVLGDETRLRQVIDNLLANVRAHTPPGTSAVLEVGIEAGEAVLRVTDNGPGLTPEQTSAVFERFYRADASRSRQSGGTGLGLAIVAAIVSAHGGRVRASRAASGGACFTVRLPLGATPDSANGAGGISTPAPELR